MSICFLLTLPLGRLAGIIQNCLHPIHLPKHMQFGLPLNDHSTWRAVLFNQRWGYIVDIELSAQTPHQTLLRFLDRDLPTPAELAPIEALVRERLEAESPSYHLADFYDSQEQIQLMLLEALQRYRQEALLQTAIWLLRRLRIYGVHLPGSINEKDAPDRDLGILLGMAEPLEAAAEAAFELLLQGTPAEFGHLVQRFVALRGKPFACRVQAPGGKVGVWETDVVNLEARIVQGKRLIVAQAHMLPDGGSLLTVWLENREEIWQVWEQVREELERLGMLRLPTVETISPPLVQEVPENVDIPLWQRIPDKGNRRLILQMWSKGYTAKEIGKRINRSWKTVDNLLSKWRREFGEEIAPLRREKEPLAGDE